MTRTNPERAEARVELMDYAASAIHKERMGAAWKAGARLLRNPEWHGWDTVTSAMADASGLHPRDCATILMGACSAGLIVRQSVAGDRCIRVTRKGLLSAAELRPAPKVGALL